MKKPTKPARRKNQPAAAIPRKTPSPQAHAQVETLQHERNLFRTILDNLPSIIFFKDQDGRYVLTNRAHQRVLGATEEAILGKTAFDFHPPDLARQYHEDEMQIVHSGEPMAPKEEQALHREMGQHRWHLTSRIPFKDESGRVVGVFGISHDITERKRVEEALRESQSLYHSFVEQLPNAVFRKDGEGRYVMVNSQFCRVKGMKAEDFLGKKPLEVVADKAAKRDKSGQATKYATTGEEIHEQILRTGKPVETDEEYSGADGRKQFLHVVRMPVFGPDGKVIGTQGIQFDITERKRAEETLRESEERYRLLFEGVTDGVFVHGITDDDLPGQFFALNDTICLRLGYTREELLRMTVLDIDAPKSTVDQRAIMARLKRGEKVLFEQIHLTKDGRRIPVEINAQLFQMQGRPMIFSVIRDITERKQAEEALCESVRRLQTVVTGAPIVLYSFDRHGIFTLSEGKGLAGMGTKPGEVVGRSVFEVFRDQPEALANLRRALAGETFTVQQSFPGGATFEISHTAMRDEAGGYAGTIGVLVDVTERDRAEQALRQSEAMLKQSQHVARLGHYKLDAVSGAWTSSETLDDVFGIDAAFKKNVAGWSKLIHPEDQKIMLAYLQDHVLKGGDPFDKEYRIVRANDGSIRWVHGLGELRFNASGKVMEMFGTIQDITERKQAEEALRRERTLLDRITTASPVGIVLLDRHGQITFVNPQAEKILGLTHEAVIQCAYNASAWHITDLAGGPLPDEELPFRRVMATGQSVTDIQHAIEWPDGRRVLLSINGTPLLGESGEVESAVFTIEDITERKRAEERIREQAALLDAANDAIYVRALDHTVIYWNDGAERLYGWTRAEALGRKINNLREVDHEAFETAHAALLEQGSWSGELKKNNKAGKEIIVFCRWTLLRDEQNRPKEVLAINTDITERKQLEANFLRAQRMEGIGALAGGIAHDLNNILQPILMTAPLLRETTGDPESREMLDTVENCAQRGADIIKQLLTFARGEPSARVPLPVRHLLGEMNKLIHETFPKNIQLRVNVPKNLWQALGDATQIHQALMNLCVNARDAMPDGGTLTLAAENLPLDEAFAAMMPGAKPGLYVCVSVTDTGMGIPPEHLDRIFDPFFTTKEIGKGTGLGLATVLGIVRGHGGVVRVNSQAGKGTTFEFYLPASPEAKAAARSERETLPPRAGGELILVVDDEASVRGVVGRTLEKHGYRVVPAAEGVEAMGLFAQHRAEVRAVLTDMMMPNMDGPSLVRALRHLEPQLPILGMTGVGEKADIKGLETLDLLVLLTKPFYSTVLLSVLHQALAAPRKAKGKP